jgi:DNA-directed RNA polymerase II subunit RPB11
MNAPVRKDSCIVPEGLAKLSAAVDGKMANATTYKFIREDHTLGQLLRMELLRDAAVRFAGYKHPHPLDNDIVLKVQSAPGSTPNQVLESALKRLENEFTGLQASFRAQAAKIKKGEEVIGAGGGAA